MNKRGQSEEPGLPATEIREALAAVGDPKRAREMAAYMKTEQPFFGTASPDRKAVLRAVRSRIPTDEPGLRGLVGALWSGPERESQYLAIDLLMARRKLIGPDMLDLYERLVREGAWWDLVDPVASHLVGGALMRSPDRLWPVLDRWIDDADMWIRRTALLAQLRLKEGTDRARLFDYCRRRMHEREFFIRKAIGWSLRQYSYSDPEAVRDFLVAEREHLSGLSLREGAKQLARVGLWQP